jgi:hypothetical protein
VSEFDDELAKILGAQQAAAAQAQAGLDEFAATLIRFRLALICGGFDADLAAEMARDYFNSILDRVAGAASVSADE